MKGFKMKRGNVYICNVCSIESSKDKEAVFAGQFAGVVVVRMGRFPALCIPGVQRFDHLAVLPGFRPSSRDQRAPQQILIHAAEFHRPVGVAHVRVDIVIRGFVGPLHVPGHEGARFRHQGCVGQRAAQNGDGDQNRARNRPQTAVRRLFPRAQGRDRQEDDRTEQAKEADDQLRGKGEIFPAEEFGAVLCVVQVRDGEKTAGQMADDAVDQT